MECHKEYFLLFFNNIGKFFFVFPMFQGHLLIRFRTHTFFDNFCFIFKLLDSDYISLYFMVNNLNSSISNLISNQEFMELSEVTVCLKDIEQIQCEFYRLFVIVSESPTDCTKQCFMLKHNFHILIT